MKKHIGYFVNQYPAVSHSFIRREILALEKHGLKVSRFAIRMEKQGVVDEADKAEAEKTRFITKMSLAELLSICSKQLVFNSRLFLSTLFFALRFNRHYEKNLIKTLICVVEGMVLAEWCKQEHIDHIHAHFGSNSTTVAMYAKCMGGADYSLTSHGQQEFDHPQAYGLNEKIRQCAFVVAISSFGRSQLCRWADFADWHKIKVVHCGLDDDFLQCPSVPVAEESISRFVCVGRLAEQKGQLLLIQAAARLINEGLRLKLVLIGEGAMRSEIEQLIKQHHLQEHVELTGSLNGEQIRQQLQQAHTFVLPSFAEGLPVVIMEAFALGRPVISTHVAGIPELVKPGKNGWLVTAGDEDELVNAMRESIKMSAEQLTLLGTQGQQNVRDRHSICIESQKLYDLFLQ